AEPLEPDPWTKPAFLQRVRIRGYKSLASCDVTLEPLTLLVGRNAAGKSNFLGALAFLRDVVDVGATSAVKRHGGWSSVLCRMNDAAMVEIEIEASYTCSAPRQRPVGNGASTPSSVPENVVTDLTGRRFTATYSIQVSRGRQSVPVIRRERLTLKDESGRDAGGFELDRSTPATPPRVVQGKGPTTTVTVTETVELFKWHPGPAWPTVDRAAEEALAPHRTDQALLGTLGFSPVIDLSENLRWMGFYNIHPEAIRRLQKPLTGVLLERDGSNLASIVRGLEQLSPASFERAQEYLGNIAEEVARFEPVPYGEYETVRFQLRSGGTPPPEFDA